MASKGKKGKKNKWQPVPLTDFIPEIPGGMPIMPSKVSSSWADDVEDHCDMYSSRKSHEPVVLPTAPRAARGPGIDEENIPTSPPFVAYISNLPYDVLEEDLAEFFAEMQVTNMRLPKDSTKLKGYGYVDFEDRQSLIDALSMANTTIKGRRVRIEVSNSNNDDRRGRMGRDYGHRDNYDDNADRESTDWRAGPREEPTSSEGDRFRSRGGGGGGGFDRGDRREERETSASDNKPGAWREGRAPLPDLPDRGGSSFGDRRGGFRGDDKDRDFSRFGDRGSRDREGSDRGGGGGGGSFGPRRNFGGDRDRDRNFGGDRERDRNFGGDRERDRNFGGDRERDRNFGGDRERDRNFGGDRERDRESDWGNRLAPRSSTSETPAAPAEPRTRVKLNLQPRTKPIDPPVVKDDENNEEKDGSESETRASAPAPAPVPAVNIFGAAKPVDTTAREREIEERLARTYADAKPKGEDGERKGPPKEGAWGRRNGEGRSDNEKERPRPTWRSEEDREKQVDKPSSRNPATGRSDARNDSRGPPGSRSATSASRSGQKPSESRGQPERERKERDREDNIPPMPKATDEQAPNFVASNKYSMLHEDADSDNSYN